MGKHQQYSPEFKVQVVLDVLRAQKSQAQICREHNVADELCSRWRQEFLTRAPEIFTTARTRSTEHDRIAELERLVGQLTLEQTILKSVHALDLSSAQKRELVMRLAPNFSVARLCAALDLARSAFYYESSALEDADLRDAMEQIALEFPRYGYRRMTAELHRREWSVNHKRIARLMREYHLFVAVKRYCRTTFSQHAYGRYPNLIKDLGIVRPDQVWVADITYIRVARDFVYLAVLMDLFTRAIRGWELSRSLSEDLTVSALTRAFLLRQPGIHHSDQGIQYAATAYTQLLKDRAVDISMAAQGVPTENAFAERLMRTLKEEEVYLHEYQDYADARAHIARFLDDVYMHKRLHSALGYVPPVEFEANYYRAQSVALKG